MQSFDGALKSAMREDPDVIMIGEMRDLDTVRMALALLKQAIWFWQLCILRRSTDFNQSDY